MQLDSELTLEKAVKMVRQQEAVRQQQVDLQRPSTSQKVNQVKFNSKKQSPKQQQQPSKKKEKSAKTRSRCPKCGGFTHREGQACRAEGQKCNLCSKTGHFANCCPDKQAKTAEVKAVSELDEEIGFLLEVSAVEDSSNLDDDEGECRRRWTAEIQVNGKKVKFKLDSQADVTCVPLCLFKKIMGQQRLVKSDINLRAAEFSELQTVGMFISTLRNGNYEIKEKIYVIRRLSEPLLSRRACELLNLARRIEVVATRINPIKEFPEVFEGLGQIGNPYEIKLKPGAKPYAVHTPRRVPIPLMEKLKTRLEELEKAGIIAQVNVATEWCAPTVIAGKPNGDIRLCVDLSRLNEHVQREVHPMPVVEHMLGQLGEAIFFSKLDANSGFHQIPLSPDCQHLTTFITPFGRYKYCRMPFGISLAPEYFQRVMSIILQGMDGVMCYLDDILIFASDSKTHDRILRLVLRKLKEAKVTLNKAKCVFGVPRINFLGHILDEDGIRPDPAKIEAVAKMPAPTDVHGVRRFLGMVNHLGRKLRTTLPIAPENLNPKLVDSQTQKRKEGRRRKDMKSRYDRRCGATDMEELSEGDTVWITDMRTWGIVKQKASTPRSLKYNEIIYIPDGVFADLPNLTKLVLKNNQLVDFDLQVLRNLPGLWLLGIKFLKSRLELSVASTNFSNSVDQSPESRDLRGIEIENIDVHQFQPLISLEFVYFKRFQYCNYAPAVRNCEPRTDGLSSTEHLVVNPLFRMAIWGMAFITFWGNMVVMCWRGFNKKEDKILSLFVQNLAAADFIMGLYLIAIGVMDALLRDRYNVHALSWMSSWQCTCCGVMAMLSCEVSVFVITLITVERYRSLHISYREMTTSKARRMLTAIWLCGLALAMLPVVWWPHAPRSFYAANGLCFPLHLSEPYMLGWEYSTFVILGLNFSAVILIICLYSRMLYIIKDDRKKARPFPLQKNEDAVLAHRFYFIVLTDCLCWIPVVVVKMVALSEVYIPDTLYAFVVLLIVPINSAINPIIYTIAAPTELRQRLKEKIDRFQKKFGGFFLCTAALREIFNKNGSGDGKRPSTSSNTGVLIVNSTDV
ncbi:RXFP1 [Cordylochernes scorpioides]|uniref:RXFP1 n=1 Tax=Cordylochernes scorpioides TaxID=51811 RepID=A0ABY6KRX5_9ARAC|nr:RXFP1 [Cordylochernes scorpioides]